MENNIITKEKELQGYRAKTGNIVDKAVLQNAQDFNNSLGSQQARSAFSI